MVQQRFNYQQLAITSEYQYKVRRNANYGDAIILVDAIYSCHVIFNLNIYHNTSYQCDENSTHTEAIPDFPDTLSKNSHIDLGHEAKDICSHYW